MQITYVSHLKDSELVSEVGRLARGEREATVALVAHLAEFDARRLFATAGFSSTFQYCLEVLRLSEDAAFNRIQAARAARRFPIVLDMLTTGALSPTTARMLAKHLTTENQQELLAAASGKCKQEVERLLARLFPQRDVPSSVRKLHSPGLMPTSSLVTTGIITAGAPSSSGGDDHPASAASACPADRFSPLAPAPPLAAIPRPVVRPLAAERYEIRFTASAETLEKLRLAQDLLGHAVPSGDLAQVVDRALTLLVQDLQRKKFAATKRPRASRGQSPESRNVPAAVRRAVSRRDGGRCAFVAPNGRRCGERRFLEFHHVHPYGARGKPTVDNIQLRCRLCCARHNLHYAERVIMPTELTAPARVTSGQHFDSA